MAKIFITLPLLTILSQIFIGARGDPTFLKSVKLNPMNLKTEKLSHFRFYWHDILSGSNPTAVTIVPPTKNITTTTAFGQINMIDDPLTEKPEAGSKLLGRAQGFYGLISQEKVALLMTMNFVFSTGKYNGSTLTVLGRNPVFQKAREMSVIGGSGLFRGYVLRQVHTALTTRQGMQLLSIMFMFYISNLKLINYSVCSRLS
ncbi:hypothetical protein L1987_83968 [Smallanthus sonchifolius]|uniref:Uncharacterized protein n=1 Tax=Smallanthus sonchifolius TaxID=185202 RepID=A0ACB8YEV9_9ASTR|nr:hypothetical protein L1987_83968 [Smallanthus sonchifolius]